MSGGSVAPGLGDDGGDLVRVLLSPGRFITDPDEAEALGMTVEARRLRAAAAGGYTLSATDKAGNPVEVRLVPLPGFGFDAGGWYDVSADGVKTYRAPTRVEGTLNGRLFPWAVGLLCGTPGRPSSLNAAYRQRQRNRVKRRRR